MYAEPQLLLICQWLLRKPVLWRIDSTVMDNYSFIATNVNSLHKQLSFEWELDSYLSWQGGLVEIEAVAVLGPITDAWKALQATHSSTGPFQHITCHEGSAYAHSSYSLSWRIFYFCRLIKLEIRVWVLIRLCGVVQDAARICTSLVIRLLSLPSLTLNEQRWGHSPDSSRLFCVPQLHISALCWMEAHPRGYLQLPSLLGGSSMAWLGLA